MSDATGQIRRLARRVRGRLPGLDAVASAAAAAGDPTALLTLERQRGTRGIAADVRSADASGVAGTPAFFIDGRRWSGVAEREALGAAVAQRIGPPDRGQRSDAPLAAAT